MLYLPGASGFRGERERGYIYVNVDIPRMTREFVCFSRKRGEFKGILLGAAFAKAHDGAC